MRLILYTKPGCHLCEGLQEKLDQIKTLNFELEVRDITTREDWFQIYQYEIPVLCKCSVTSSLQQLPVEEQLPRPSPRATVQHLEQMLQKYLYTSTSE